MRSVATHIPEGSRIPPQAVEVEESVLGTMLLETTAMDLAFEHLVAEDFYKTLHRQTFKAMTALQLAGNNVDMITVEQKLKDAGVDFGTNFLPDLTRSASSSTMLVQYAQIIKEKAIKRQMILHCNEIIKQSYDASTDTYDVVDDAQERLFSLLHTDSGTLHEISDIMQNVVTQISEIQDQGKPLGLQTGLSIDEMLRGFQNGKLYVIGARPSMGKTALVITIQNRLAHAGIKSGLISLETTSESLGVRLMAQETKISAERLTSGELTKNEIELLLKAANTLSQRGIVIDDSTSVTTQQVRSKCRLMKRQGCKIVFIDFLTLIKESGRSKHEEVGDIMKALKSVSKELNIPIVALSQLSRNLETRANKRPMLSDLRESGSIEEDADGILFLYRDEYYGITATQSGQSTAGVMEVIIAKNKDGKTGMKKLFFEKETMTVKNLDLHHKYDINEPSGF